jgi:hypothetical protein
MYPDEVCACGAVASLRRLASPCVCTCVHVLARRRCTAACANLSLRQAATTSKDSHAHTPARVKLHQQREHVLVSSQASKREKLFTVDVSMCTAHAMHATPCTTCCLSLVTNARTSPVRRDRREVDRRRGPTSLGAAAATTNSVRGRVVKQSGIHHGEESEGTQAHTAAEGA